MDYWVYRNSSFFASFLCFLCLILFLYDYCRVFLCFLQHCFHVFQHIFRYSLDAFILDLFIDSFQLLDFPSSQMPRYLFGQSIYLDVFLEHDTNIIQLFVVIVDHGILIQDLIQIGLGQYWLFLFQYIHNGSLLFLFGLIFFKILIPPRYILAP